MGDAATVLGESARTAGSLLCVGLDPRVDLLPAAFQQKHAPAAGGTNGAGDGNEGGGSHDGGGRNGKTATADHRAAIVEDLADYYHTLLDTIAETKRIPGAWKPNIAYFHRLDRPLEDYYGGSRLLAALLGRMRREFPGIPVILDAKRGDIAESSWGYAEEAFDCWNADAVTVSPLMGDDSVEPFLTAASRAGRWVYILTRTSNSGARRFQDLHFSEGRLFDSIARAIVEWHGHYRCAGAVVGATAMSELAALLEYFQPHGVPILIPGVGAQGASAGAVMDAVRATGYDPSLVRINVSRKITAADVDSPSRNETLSRVGRAYGDIHEAFRWM